MTDDPDPRFLRSRQAMLDAARELLLAHGPGAVTHHRIAEHAGIGRATVYRHWPQPEQLLAEAMATVPLPFFEAPASPFRPWLAGEFTSLARELELDEVRAVATTLANAALWNPGMDARRAGFAGVLSRRLAAALTAAEQAGELSLRGEPSDAAALAIGPLYYRATIERAPADAALIERCVDAVGVWTSR
ncbi:MULTISPECIES: TetR/AcrR family transcriptional regulator [Microbacterium]|uniref:TetR/AcrR family transcriptional regulator n=1 Tax=Microbacterium wangchenii TaxID=2541726 RepID=A0ABX5SQ75_9MICO|nr:MULTISPECIES: TetR/AcrR family transcriptional regulator [Microbacterium]MCK6066400.1 TetR/AcrR family transcriptional regulator [Microbacterium sp. EYE_512]QBR87367.1 TetR/AcrR family transcriptional regulator [Microbacterium wangchenii]TXK14689.1 TetR/AcrR family transcriptional regulator [Microbacterium wangchenii]